MTTMAKRDRLVEAARTVFYQQGVTRSACDLKKRIMRFSGQPYGTVEHWNMAVLVDASSL